VILRSHIITRKYELGEHGHPINPIARTGFIKRGELYQWGPSKGVGAILYTINEHNEFMFLGVLSGKYERPEGILNICFSCKG